MVYEIIIDYTAVCNIISLCIFVAKDLSRQNFKVTAVKLIFADDEINLLYLL